SARVAWLHAGQPLGRLPGHGQRPECANSGLGPGRVRPSQQQLGHRSWHGQASMNALTPGLHAQLLKRKVSGRYPPARWRATWLAAVAVMLVVHLLAGAVLASGGPYAGKLGFDISYPQCGQTTLSGAFAIVGVNGG